jgi:hypothetical protein
VHQVLHRGTGATTNNGSDALSKPCGPVHSYRFQNREKAQSTGDLSCGEITNAIRPDSVTKSIIKVRMWKSLQLIMRLRLDVSISSAKALGDLNRHLSSLSSGREL